MTASPYRDRIEAKLTAGLSPQRLVIIDDSHRHAGHGDRIAALKALDARTLEATGRSGTAGQGHAPVDGGGETHFRVEVVSSAFEGKSRVDRQRMVNALLADELRERVHALQLRTLTPQEAGAA